MQERWLTWLAGECNRQASELAKDRYILQTGGVGCSCLALLVMHESQQHTQKHDDERRHSKRAAAGRVERDDARTAHGAEVSEVGQCWLQAA